MAKIYERRRRWSEQDQRNTTQHNMGARLCSSGRGGGTQGPSRAWSTTSLTAHDVWLRQQSLRDAYAWVHAAWQVCAQGGHGDGAAARCPHAWPAWPEAWAAADDGTAAASGHAAGATGKAPLLRRLRVLWSLIEGWRAALPLEHQVTQQHEVTRLQWCLQWLSVHVADGWRLPDHDLDTV